MYKRQRLKSQEKLIKSLREVNSVRRQEKEDKVVQNKALIESIEQDQSQRKDELSVLDKQLIDTESHQYILSDLKSKTADLKSEMKRVSKEMKFLKSHDTCPTCTQTISTEFKEGKIESLTTSGVDYAKKLKKEQKAIEDEQKELIGSKTGLAVIPSGSGNGFAYHFGVKRKINEALKQLHSNNCLLYTSPSPRD